MRINCLGGGREVGRNAILIEGKENILFDYGVKVETSETPKPANKVDNLVLGHAHLDHCLHPDTFVQLSNGEISKIKDVTSERLVPAVDFDNSMRLDNIPCLQRGKINYSGKMLEMSTRSHTIKITPEHQFFTLSGLSYSMKKAAELKLGDYIAVINKADIEGTTQKLPRMNGFPSSVNEELMQLLGYMCGDGDFESVGFNCTDKNINNLIFYAGIVKSCLGLKSHIHSRERNRLRVFSVKLMKWLKVFVPEILQKSRLRTVPQIICKSKKNEIASFLRGIFDAEGSVKHHSIVLCSSSKELMQQIQILMLRFGINSQIYEMDQSKSTFGGKEEYQLSISNPTSLKIFDEFIGFSDKTKNKKFKKILLKMGNACAPKIDLIPIEGKTIIEFGEKIGLRKIDLRRLGIRYYHYLHGHKLSRKATNNLVTKLLGIAKEKNREVYKELLYLKNIVNSNVGWEPVKSIKEIELDANGVFDLTVPGHSNYIANGIVVHNCGSIPILYRKSKFPTFSTIATFDQAHLLLKDSLKIGRIKGFVKHFGESDIEKMKKNEARVTYGQRFEAENFSMDVFDAGHIPGSIAPLIEMNGKRILYVSDFNTNPTRLLNGAKIDAKDVDVLILESTYSNRNHPDRNETEKKFFEAIQGTISNGGVAVLPCFAVGRAAEILMILDRFKANFPIYLDGMAKEATEIALNYPEFIKDPKALRKALDDVKPIYSNDERKKITKEPCAIVTSSGMLEGGPSVMYVKYLYDNIESSIIFTGFILPRTAGRYLVDTGRFVTEGFDLKIKMGIHAFDFSAHSGRDDLFDFVNKIKPEKVVCIHGDNCERFATELRGRGFDATAPKNGDTIDIN